MYIACAFPIVLVLTFPTRDSIYYCGNLDTLLVYHLKFTYVQFHCFKCYNGIHTIHAYNLMLIQIYMV